MDVLVGENIKKYRRQKGMTQKELADAIGVSVQAVSKWECGATPDISQISLLCAVLGTSADELLNCNHRLKELNDGWYDMLKKHGEGSLEIIEYEKNVLLQFPNDETFGYRLATDYDIHAQMCEDIKEKHYYWNKAKKQFVALLKKNPDDEIVRSCLVNVCMQLSEREEAMQYALESKRKDMLLRHVYKGDDLLCHNQMLIDRKFVELIQEMLRSDDIKVWYIARNMIQQAFPEGNYQRYFRHLLRLCIRIAGELTRVGDQDAAMEELWKTVDLIKNEEVYLDSDVFTTPLFDHLDIHKEWHDDVNGGGNIWVERTEGGAFVYLQAVLSENGLFYPYLKERQDFKQLMAVVDSHINKQKGTE